MLDLREGREFRPYMQYMVSFDGYMFLPNATQSGPAGRFLMPTWAKGTGGIYFIRDKRPIQRSISTIVEDVFGAKIKVSEIAVTIMREAVEAYHREFLPSLTGVRNEQIKQSILDKNKPDSMDCPWESNKLGTLPPGVRSWDDPIMCPMGRMWEGGVWFETSEDVEVKAA